MKICSRCKIEQEDNRFRLRYDKRGKGSKTLLYFNNICRQCDTEVSNKYYFKNKDDNKFRINWIKKSRDYYNAHLEEIKSKTKIKRQTLEYKERIKVYRQKNKEKIYQQEVITKRRYHEKHRDNLTDEYIIRQMITQGYGSRESLAKCPELIAAKRIQLLIKREILKNDKH